MAAKRAFVAPGHHYCIHSGSSKTLAPNQTSHKPKLDWRQLVYSTNQFSPQPIWTLQDWASNTHRASLGKPKHEKAQTRKSKYLCMWILAVHLLYIRYVRGMKTHLPSTWPNVSWWINNVSTIPWFQARQWPYPYILIRRKENMQVQYAHYEC